MPSWSKLPEESRWQVIAYVKSLGLQSASATPSKSVHGAPARELAPGKYTPD
jgi:hypothetical protein